MGQAQNPLSLNRYLYAHANPLVLIDLDGHRATEYDGNSGRYQNAVADARAAVTATRSALNAASSAYGWATAAANWARGRLSDPCPLTQCPGREDRADWRQSRLDAYTAAVTIRDQARARYAAAASAYSAAQQQLRIAAAQVSKRSKPAATARAAPSRSSPATRADDGGILGGFVRGLWNATGGFALSLVGDPVGTIVGTVEPFAYVATHLDRAPADFMAGVDYMRSQSVSDRVEFLTTIATGVVISRKLPSIRARAPAGTIAAEAGIPAIKVGTSGGATAGKAFPWAVRDAALLENPSTCVFCQMETNTPRVDHAIPRARGGDATIGNAQTACPWCNGSKGVRDFPVNPPPGYEGPFPPPWWQR